jgi:hypothetical protein
MAAVRIEVTLEDDELIPSTAPTLTGDDFLNVRPSTFDLPTVWKERDTRVRRAASPRPSDGGCAPPRGPMS